ncbi:MAG: FAD-binding protein, partial [Burkholderiaceae bacterium]
MTAAPSVLEDRFADLAAAPAPARQRQVVDRLLAILPAHCVLYREEQTRPYECDALSAFRQLPMVVVLPETEEQVRGVLVACRELDVPVVARGAGTSLSGGSMPHA